VAECTPRLPYVLLRYGGIGSPIVSRWPHGTANHPRGQAPDGSDGAGVCQVRLVLHRRATTLPVRATSATLSPCSWGRWLARGLTGVKEVFHRDPGPVLNRIWPDLPRRIQQHGDVHLPTVAQELPQLAVQVVEEGQGSVGQRHLFRRE